jgi:hypothetical protein
MGRNEWTLNVVSLLDYSQSKFPINVLILTPLKILWLGYPTMTQAMKPPRILTK